MGEVNDRQNNTVSDVVSDQLDVKSKYIVNCIISFKAYEKSGVLYNRKTSVILLQLDSFSCLSSVGDNHK